MTDFRWFVGGVFAAFAAGLLMVNCPVWSLVPCCRRGLYPRFKVARRITEVVWRLSAALTPIWSNG